MRRLDPFSMHGLKNRTIAAMVMLAILVPGLLSAQSSPAVLRHFRTVPLHDEVIGVREIRLVGSFRSVPGRNAATDTVGIVMVGREGIGAGRMVAATSVPSIATRFHVPGGPIVNFAQPIRETVDYLYSGPDRMAIAVRSHAPTGRDGLAKLVIDWYDPRGAVARSATFDMPTVIRTAAERQRFLDSMITTFRSGADSPSAQALREPVAAALYSPPWHPLLKRALAAPSGNVWVWLATPGNRSGTFCAVSRHIQQMDCAEVPSGHQPLAVGPRQQVLLLAFDPDGLPLLHEFHFLAPRE